MVCLEWLYLQYPKTCKVVPGSFITVIWDGHSVFWCSNGRPGRWEERGRGSNGEQKPSFNRGDISPNYYEDAIHGISSLL